MYWDVIGYYDRISNFPFNGLLDAEYPEYCYGIDRACR